MQHPPLTTASLYRVASTPSGPDAKIAITGIYQVLELKSIGNALNAKPRYRMRLGDGQYTLQTMVSSQVTDLIMSNVLTPGAIVEIKDFIINLLNNKMRLYIAFNCTVLDQYGTYASPIIVPPNTELVDVSKITEDSAGGQPAQPAPAQQPQQGPTAYGGQNQAGYGPGAPQPNNGGMYGGPPPPANGNYQQGPPQGGMYGQPPPTSNGGNGVGNGNAFGGGGNGQNGMAGPYGGTNPQQQAGGMYGGPPPATNVAPANGYGGPGGNAAQGSYNPYVAGGNTGGSRPAPQYQAQGAIARDDAPPRIIPISALNPYTARWAIRARVTSKSELRKWTNVKGEGKVFSFDLLDREGGEIRATAFGAEADKFYDMVEAGAIYQLSKASLVNKRAQFNHTNHQYEIRLDRNSLLERQAEDQDTVHIPTINFNFRRITELETVEAGAMVDVIGVVESVEPWQTITRKTGEETQKRSMVLRDDSGRSIEVTLWGPLVSNPGDQIEQGVRNGGRPVLAAKALRVGDFNGRTLSTVGASSLRIDPMDLPAAQRLRQWYDSGGRSQAVNSLSNAGLGGGGGKADRRTTFSAIKDEHLGTSGKPDWVTVSGVLDMIKVDNGQGGPSAVVYPSCPAEFNGRVCQKKMMDVGGGNWNCERCSKTTDNPIWRYLVSMSACDHTAKQFLTAFGDAGDAIFGRSAADLRALEAENPTEFDRLTESIRFTPFTFRLKVAEDNYNDESRIKVSIYRLERLTDFVKESGLMLQYIKALEAGQPVLCTGGPSGSVAAAASAGARGNMPQGGGYGAGGGAGGHYGGGPPSNTFNSTAPSGNPYASAPPPTNPYVAGPPGGGHGGPPPRTPPPAAGGGGMYGGAPPGMGGYNQQGGGSAARGGDGGGMYGGAPPPQQQQGYGGGGYQNGGPGYNGGGGAYGGGGPGGGGGFNNGGQGGGWNGGPQVQQQGGGGGGMYGAPPPHQNANGNQAPPKAFW